jgi:hypothetical protein
LTSIFDLASVGGMFLLSLILPAVFGDTASLPAVSDGELAFGLGLAAGVGAVVSVLTNAVVQTYFDGMVPSDDAVAAAFPETLARAKRIGGRFGPRTTLYYCFRTQAPASLQEWVDGLRSSAEAGFRAAAAISLGVAGSLFVFGLGSLSAVALGVAAFLIFSAVIAGWADAIKIKFAILLWTAEVEAAKPRRTTQHYRSRTRAVSRKQPVLPLG